ncbi:serine hydrolase [Lewinella sp. W8]|uniref:serine hydrolase domain-containing protein n=1 Tax=Lewinella sp. W8 TaxID=2528208 RepID=UPI001067F038|nr:serine hydrolase domain-containing protein [Lewinella sp. W8]MTB51080.1 serine hydrolase [Lewinella sp. W8]
MANVYRSLPRIAHLVLPAIILILLVLLQACGRSTLPPPRANGPAASWELSDQVDELVLQIMSEHQLPGIAVGVARADTVLYARGYGWADLDTLRTVTETTLFHTASVSKLFTAQAVMQLVADGALDLDDRIVALIPGLQVTDPRFSDVTVRQLLNHTSGLPDLSNYHWRRYHTDPGSLERYLLAEDWQLSTTPGTTFAYSNLGYDLLGHVVATVSQQAFEDYVKARVLEPGKMHDSDFRHFLLPDSLLARPHTRHWLTGAVRTRTIYPYTREHAPSSTLNASPEELAKWMANVLGALAREKEDGFWRQMVDPSTVLTDRIGLGFQRYDLDGTAAVGHFGGDRGFRSFLVLVPESDLGVVVMGNGDYAEDFRREIARGILDLLMRTDE